MSSKINGSTQYYKSLYNSCRCIGQTSESKVVRDNFELIASGILILESMLADLSQRSLPLVELGTLSDLVENFLLIVDDLKKVGLKLRNEKTYDFRSFKRSIVKQHTGYRRSYLDRFFNIIRSEMIWQQEDIESFGRIYCVTQVLSRLTVKDENLITEAKETFLNLDSGLSSYRAFPELVRVLTKWLVSWSYDMQEFFPQHSSGATSDTISAKEKSFELKYSCIHSSKMLKYHPYFQQEPSILLDSLVEGGYTSQKPYSMRMEIAEASVRPAKVIFVPKTASSLRTICAESSVHMFLQQGVMKSLYSFFKKNPKIARHIDLQDSGKNAHLAYVGSRDGSYVTIDLSSASDRVSWAVVKDCFKNTRLLKYLLMTRTRVFDVDGTFLEAEKFAPMGSALCFPIECLLFAGICETCVTKTMKGINPYMVYGDDIVAHPDYVDIPLLIERLESVGSIINRSKTYLRGPFRESCGGEYRYGNDVTPARISRNFRGLHGVSFSEANALVPFINEMYLRDFPICRRNLISLLKESDQLRYIPFGYATPENVTVSTLTWTEEGESDSERVIFSTHPTNFHLETRWNTRLQRREYKVRSTGTKVEGGCDQWRYHHWWTYWSNYDTEIDRVSYVGEVKLTGRRTDWRPFPH